MDVQRRKRKDPSRHPMATFFFVPKMKGLPLVEVSKPNAKNPLNR